VTTAIFAAAAASAADSPREAVAQKGYAFLKKYCHSCHGVEEEVAGFKVLDRQILVAKRPGKKLPYIDESHPEQPDKSLLWLKVVKRKEMPPSYADPAEYPSPTDEERKVIDEWVRAGAPLPRGDTREHLAEFAVLAMIRDRLRDPNLDSLDRKYERFFVLTNLHNNPSVNADQLRYARAATSKLLNSLSWKRDIRPPQVLDPDGARAVLRIDLRWYGWTPDTWELIRASYPYGVAHSEDRRYRELEREIAEQSGTRLAYLRADWFVANASLPPLYEQILHLPKTLSELERDLLFLEVQKNFLHDEVARAGMVQSNVSLHNRVVERHETRYGAYWRSYDFNSSDLKGNIVRFPLGPAFEANPFADFAFVQAGGEVLWNLPNGLQAYMLADAKDRRLDGPAPVTIVRDRGEKAGSVQVLTGLSCMACHAKGMIEFGDAVRNRPAVFGDAGEKVRRIYAAPDRMKELVAQDRDTFLKALERACGAFLRDGDEKDRSIDQFPEPIVEVVQFYLRDLTLETAAAEFGYKAVDEFRRKVEHDPSLTELGLGPMLDNGGVKRELWQRTPLSLFHQVGFSLDLTAVK
jgi:serine/threonine-protein kinase